MQQFIEFFGNHTILFMAFFATLGMLIYTEYTRSFSGVAALTPYAATQKLNSGNAIFIDVREDAEYKAGHVLNARNMPVNGLDNRLHELDKFKEKDVVVYCENGMRASKATSKLRKNGFSNLFTLAGGLTAWEKANLPTVKK